MFINTETTNHCYKRKCLLRTVIGSPGLGGAYLLFLFAYL